MELTREVVVDASVDEVWRLITDERELATWLADSVTLEPRRPGAIGRMTDGDDVWRVRVDEVDTDRRLRLTWWPDGNGAASEVTFTVEEAQRGTRLRVRERVSGGVSPKGRRAHAAVWDQRLLGFELRCLAQAELAHC
ncbi:MAG: SRPBCC domain-containing protein [Acidimicrobiales bacterium]